MNTIKHILNNSFKALVNWLLMTCSANILKPDTDQMLLKYDTTKQEWAKYVLLEQKHIYK